MRRKGLPWTARDDALLRKFHAEKRSDRDIGYIMDRCVNAIRKCRKRLGLKANGQPGSPKGWRHTAETRAALSAAMRERWERPVYREKMMAHLMCDLQKAREVSLQNRFRRPPKGTPEYNLYMKLSDAIGAPKARQEMGL